MSTSTAVASVVGNAVIGLDLQTTTLTASSTATEVGSDGQSHGYLLTQTQTSNDGRTQLSNDITGGFNQQDAGTANTTLSETGTNAAGGFSIVQTSADTSSQSESGNSLNGNYSLALRLVQGYTLNQTDTGRAGAYTLTESGTALTVRQETGSALDGSYTANASGSDVYGMTETGFDGNANPVSATLSGVDSSSAWENGNAFTGDLSRTQNGQGYVNRDGVSVSYTVQESGNAVASGFSLSESGTDRYALLPQFDNAASSGTGTAPARRCSPAKAPLTASVPWPV